MTTQEPLFTTTPKCLCKHELSAHGWRGPVRDATQRYQGACLMPGCDCWQYLPELG